MLQDDQADYVLFVRLLLSSSPLWYVLYDGDPCKVDFW